MNIYFYELFTFQLTNNAENTSIYCGPGPACSTHADSQYLGQSFVASHMEAFRNKIRDNSDFHKQRKHVAVI